MRMTCSIGWKASAIAAVLSAVLTVAGCGGAKSTAAATPTPTPAPAPSPAPNPSPSPAPTPSPSPSPTPKPSPTPTPVPSPSPSPSPTPSPTPGVQQGPVFVVVEENHGYSSVVGSSAMPYLNSLATQYGLATQYYANFHPSIGNYFMMTTGLQITLEDAFTGTVTQPNIVSHLTAAQKTWKSYAESLPSVGYTGGDQYPYARHHNPFSYFSNVITDNGQVRNLVPFTQFLTDLNSGTLPDYSFVVPNLLDDAHDCPGGGSNCLDSDKLTAADNWLKTNIAPLIGSAAFQKNGLLLIVFDEAETSDSTNGGGRVAMVAVGPKVKTGSQSTAFYQHQSLLKTITNYLGIDGNLGQAATAPAMSDLVP